jgi:hypothetical protein
MACEMLLIRSLPKTNRECLISPQRHRGHKEKTRTANRRENMKTNRRWTQIYADNVGFDCIHSKASAIDFLDGNHLFLRVEFLERSSGNAQKRQFFRDLNGAIQSYLRPSAVRFQVFIRVHSRFGFLCVLCVSVVNSYGVT